MRRPGEVLTRLELIEQAWDFAYETRSNVIDVYIRRLRRKLDAAIRGTTRSRRSGASATGCETSDEPRADPGAGRCRVRRGDGDRARRRPASSSMPGSAMIWHARWTRTCACERRTSQRSSVTRGNSLAAESGGRLIEPGESFAQLLDRARSGARRDPLARAHAAAAPQRQRAPRCARGARFFDRASVPGLDEPARLLAVPVDRPADGRARDRRHAREPRRGASQPAHRAADRRPAGARGRDWARATCSPGTGLAGRRGNATARGARSPQRRAGERLPVPRTGDELAAPRARRSTRCSRGSSARSNASAASSPRQATSSGRRSRCCAPSSTTRCTTPTARRSSAARCAAPARRPTASCSWPATCC